MPRTDLRKHKPTLFLLFTLAIKVSVSKPEIKLSHVDPVDGPSVHCSQVKCSKSIVSTDYFTEAATARCCVENLTVLSARASLFNERPEAYVLYLTNRPEEKSHSFQVFESPLKVDRIVGFVNGQPVTFCQRTRPPATSDIWEHISSSESVLLHHLDSVVRFFELFSTSSQFIREAWRQMKWNPKVRRDYLVVGSCLPVRAPLPEGVPTEIVQAFRRFDFSFDIWLTLLTEASVGDLLTLFHLCLLALYLEIMRHFENALLPKLPAIDFEALGPDFRFFEVFLNNQFVPMDRKADVIVGTGAMSGTRFESLIPDLTTKP